MMGLQTQRLDSHTLEGIVNAACSDCFIRSNTCNSVGLFPQTFLIQGPTPELGSPDCVTLEYYPETGIMRVQLSHLGPCMKYSDIYERYSYRKDVDPLPALLGALDMRPGIHLPYRHDLDLQCAWNWKIEDRTDYAENIVRFAHALVTQPISSHRFFVGSFINKGFWGRVYKGYDALRRTEVAIKILDTAPQASAMMEKLKLNQYDELKRELPLIGGCSNIVPREPHISTETSMPFIVMPYYPDFLHHHLDESGTRKSVRQGTMSVNETVTILGDIAKGLHQLHTRLNRAHRDLKPDNIALDNQVALLADIGTASIIKNDPSPQERGFLQTRAPECRWSSACSDPRQDIWSLGSLAYRMFEGRYILEEELSTQGMDVFNDPATTGLVAKKVRRSCAPGDVRTIIDQCLRIDDRQRYPSMQAVIDALEEYRDSTERRARHYRWLASKALPWVLAATGIGAFAYMAATAPRQQLHPARVGVEARDYFTARRQVMPLEPKDNDSFEFIAEKLALPTPELKYHEKTILPREPSEIQLLGNAYFAASRSISNESGDLVGEPRNAIWVQFMMEKASYGGSSVNNYPPQRLASALVYSIRHCELSDGTVDLEDVMVCTTCGPTLLHEAKETSRSFDFAQYSDAKRQDGSYVITPQTKEFILRWRAFFDATNK